MAATTRAGSRSAGTAAAAPAASPPATSCSAGIARNNAARAAVNPSHAHRFAPRNAPFLCRLWVVGCALRVPGCGFRAGGLQVPGGRLQAQSGTGLCVGRPLSPLRRTWPSPVLWTSTAIRVWDRGFGLQRSPAARPPRHGTSAADRGPALTARAKAARTRLSRPTPTDPQPAQAGLAFLAPGLGLRRPARNPVNPVTCHLEPATVPTHNAQPTTRATTPYATLFLCSARQSPTPTANTKRTLMRISSWVNIEPIRALSAT